MRSSGASAEIKVIVLGEWVPAQLAEVLALQRVEEPETETSLTGCSASTIPTQDLQSDQFDFALSTAAWEWPGWTCEPLWHDTLAVAVAKRSHLLAYPEVPQEEVLKQPLICAQSTADDPWRTVLRQLFGDALQERQQTVTTFDVAMTLVSAGYGIALAPAKRLAGYAQRGGIAVRPLAGAPLIVMAYLLHRCAALSEPQARFAQRAHSVA
ncbi:MAG: substrate-binding domain-containing protein [Burkholderiales bacterium]|nr:substrate-binding domain-containing protein [Burkholderiales bacterium]